MSSDNGKFWLKSCLGLSLLEQTIAQPLSIYFDGPCRYAFGKEQ